MGADPHPQEQSPHHQKQTPCAVHAGRYRQQAGSMHSTGMHTCLLDFFTQLLTYLWFHMYDPRKVCKIELER